MEPVSRTRGPPPRRPRSVSAYVAEAMAARQAKTQALADLEEVLGQRPPLGALNEVRARLGLPLLPMA